MNNQIPLKTSYKKLLVFPLLLIGLLLISGCGGGGSSGIGSGIGGTGIGIGGTGKGQITNFGSVVINDTRKFNINSKTNIFIDDVRVSESTLRNRGLGMIARFDIASDVNADISAGTAVNIFADNYLKGPVTLTSPLQVFGQGIEITGDTVVVGTTLGNLSVGDIIEISGYQKNNGVEALRLERKAGGTAVWKLSGVVNNVTASRFNIGSQIVNLNGVTPKNCAGGLKNGLNVEVKISPVGNFRPGNAVRTTTKVECKNIALLIPANHTSGAIKAEFEGIVSSVNVNNLSINNQAVIIKPSTRFIGGSRADLIVGTRVETEGALNTVSKVLSATKITFRQTRVRIEAPLNIPRGGLGNSFTIMDTITVNTTPSTRDRDNLIGGGSSGLQQVEVRGFTDKKGQVVAEEIRERGNADRNDTRLRGPVSSMTASTFRILGVSVNTSTATSIRDKNGKRISLDQFVRQVSNGTLVQVNNGNFRSSPPRISNADIEIED